MSFSSIHWTIHIPKSLQQVNKKCRHISKNTEAKQQKKKIKKETPQFTTEQHNLSNISKFHTFKQCIHNTQPNQNTKSPIPKTPSQFSTPKTPITVQRTIGGHDARDSRIRIDNQREQQQHQEP